jgi:hypothetical protein
VWKGGREQGPVRAEKRREKNSGHTKQWRNHLGDKDNASDLVRLLFVAEGQNLPAVVELLVSAFPLGAQPKCIPATDAGQGCQSNE